MIRVNLPLKNIFTILFTLLLLILALVLLYIYVRNAQRQPATRVATRTAQIKKVASISATPAPDAQNILRACQNIINQVKQDPELQLLSPTPTLTPYPTAKYNYNYSPTVAPKPTLVK